MIDKDKLIKVTNRDNGSVGYTIPDLNNLHRNFNSGESKEITMEELRKLSWIPGGMSILENYLVIDDKEAVAEILSNVEPEYYYTQDDVKNLLLKGSLDELKDCLDFAPEGTINLVKQYAVELQLNDINKRKAILEKTGFNVDSAILVNQETTDETQSTEKTRRVATPSASTNTTSGRRVQPSRYNVVSMK